MEAGWSDGECRGVASVLVELCTTVEAANVVKLYRTPLVTHNVIRVYCLYQD